MSDFFRRTWSQLQTSRRHIYGPLVVLWLTLSIVSVVVTAVTWKRLMGDVDRAVDLASVNETLDRLFLTLQAAEASQRGFIITGEEQYLAPFLEAEQNFPRFFDKLAALAVNDPELQKDLFDLRGLAEVKLSELRQTIQLRRSQGFASAAAVVITDQGRKTMEQTRRLVEKMHRLRLNIFTTDGLGTRAKLERANQVSMVAGLFGVGAGFFAFYLTRQALQHSRRERELAEAKLEAERRSEEKSSFLANMSHEIRTPMNAILGFSELLDRQLTEPRQRHYLHSIRSSADSLLQLINDILDLSKIEAGVTELRPEPTNPRELCEFIRTVFSEQATRKGLKLTCQTAPDLPKALLLDHVRLRQILINVVGNAIKFTERGSVRVSVTMIPSANTAKTGQSNLLIEVEDTGVGIPSDKIEAIFQPFVQAGTSREMEIQGTGLGLAIVLRLVQMMGGTITVSSEVDAGTSIQIEIPDVAVSARLPLPAQRDQDRSVDFAELEPARIVVVDDNAANRQLMAGLFENSGHELFFGTDGSEAVDLIRDQHPDVVLLDIRMPRLDGRQALAEIRRLSRDDTLPIIAVTASSLLDDERILRREFSGYLRKPFTQRELFDQLAQFLNRRPAAASASPPPSFVPPSNLDRWRVLLDHFREFSLNEWRACRDSGAINEIRAFAENLASLGRDAGCPPVVNYARLLLDHAAAYSIGDLEHELARFPEIVHALESSVSDLKTATTSTPAAPPSPDEATSQV